MSRYAFRIFFGVLVLGSAAAWFGIPIEALAQGRLFISPKNGTYYAGEPFSVLVVVDSGGLPMNAASAQINFDNERLSVTGLGYSRSLFTIWTQEPTASDAAGTITFSGGLPSPGFMGSSGNILRITFTPKKTGTAPVQFLSGAVLANDGAGTNIVQGLEGATFFIQQPKPPLPPSAVPPTPPLVPIKVERPLESPVITEWPRQLLPGEMLAVNGLGLPSAKLVLFVGRGTSEPERFELITGSDGQFSFVFPGKTESGVYRIWARHIAFDGVMSGTSETVTVEVVPSLFFRFGNIAINYLSLVLTLIALLLLLIFLLLLILFSARRRHVRQGNEITEAERAVHKSFDELKRVLGGYINHLLGRAPSAKLRQREKTLSENLLKNLENLEKRVEKEVEDIKEPKK